MYNIKFTDAQQAKSIYNFNNTKNNFCRANAAIWYKRICKMGSMCWTYDNFFNKLPENGALVPKHVEFGT